MYYTASGVPIPQGSDAFSPAVQFKNMGDWAAQYENRVVVDIDTDRTSLVAPMLRDGIECYVKATGATWTYKAGVWKARGTRIAARARAVAANNAFTGAYADFPQSADKTALDMSFEKVSSTSKLVVTLHMRAEFTSGTPGGLIVGGVNIGGTDYDVATDYTQTVGTRRTISGVVEIPSIGAGTLAIKPRIRYSSTGTVTFYAAAADCLSYSVTEAE